MTDASEPKLRQLAALCWRCSHMVEVLLITSRKNQRWIIPKGWPHKRRTLFNSAAAEAAEEAGVFGEISKTPIGHYRTLRKKWGVARPCRVDVYSLRVSLELDEWPEMNRRERVWLPPNEAASRVDNPELRRLILTHLDPRHGLLVSKRESA
jgi:8-oxo-dGTP pyrophosphatase MutT (NUDIX family)